MSNSHMLAKSFSANHCFPKTHKTFFLRLTKNFSFDCALLLLQTSYLTIANNYINMHEPQLLHNGVKDY